MSRGFTQQEQHYCESPIIPFPYNPFIQSTFCLLLSMASFVSRGATRTFPAQSLKEGAGVTIRRTLGNRIDYFDPFLLLDEIRCENPKDYLKGFPDHPHRGFETVTYMLEGSMKHEDHKGNKGLLTSGAVQWMTAGRGIVHSEMPMQKDGKLHGFQMWVNLPSKMKMCPPRYQDFQANQIPVVLVDRLKKEKVNVTSSDQSIDREGFIAIKVMTGEAFGVQGAVTGIATGPLFLDISLPPDTNYQHSVDSESNCWCYVFDGEGTFGHGNSAMKAGESTLITFDSNGNGIEVSSGEKSVRFLLAAARPLNEPMARYGPFVMNTREEIEQAFSDYHNGRLQQ
jgi:redox-sensitive bicupin YhaK (pirin superfamily)